jgi:hypothetical protein
MGTVGAAGAHVPKLRRYRDTRQPRLSLENLVGRVADHSRFSDRQEPS